MSTLASRDVKTVSVVCRMDEPRRCVGLPWLIICYSLPIRLNKQTHTHTLMWHPARGVITMEFGCSDVHIFARRTYELNEHDAL